MSEASGAERSAASGSGPEVPEPKSKSTGRVPNVKLKSFNGDPKRYQHRSVAEIMTSEGLSEIWKVLDEEFSKAAYLKADEAYYKYDRHSRRNGQKMDEYLRELKHHKRMLEVQDPESRI